MVINEQLIIIIIIIIIITIQPRSVLGSFDVVLMSCKVNFQVVRSVLQNSMCTPSLSPHPPPPPGCLSLNFGHMWGAKTCMYVQLI